MAKRVCPEPGCPALVDKGPCTAHRRDRDAARGRRQARGYDAAYDALRRSYQRRMDAGEVFDCWRCRELGKPHPVDPTSWHLGHAIGDRSTIRGPQCPASNIPDAIATRIGVGGTPPDPT